MSNQPQGGAPADTHRGLRVLGLVAVAAGVLVLMAAAFVLSYTGIHAIALSAGVSPRFARIYPVIFDAMLVVACAAVLALRGAGLPSRCYAWLTMLVLLAAAAGADTVHATSTRLPHKPTAAAAAIIPWVLVLLGFGLLLSMLRHARLRRAAPAASQEREFTQPAGHVEVQQRPGLDDLFSSRKSPDVPAARYVPPARPLPMADAAPDLAIEIEPGHDDPSSDEGHPSAQIAERQEQPVGGRGNPASAFSPAPTLDLVNDAEAGAADGSGRPAEAGTVPVPRRALRPEPEPAPAAKPKAAVVTRPAADPKPTAVAKPATVARPAAVLEPAMVREPAAETKAGDTGPAASPAPKAQRPAKARPAPKAQSAAAPEQTPATEPTSAVKLLPAAEPAPETQPEPETQPAAETEPASASDAEAAPLQFDRVRSSPVPPEA